MVLQSLAELQWYEKASTFITALLAATPNSERFKTGGVTRATTQLRQMLVGFTFLAGQYNDAYDGIRSLLVEQSNNTALWNVFAHIVHKSQHMRSSHPIIVRILKANPHIFPVLMFLAHFHLSSGTSRVALRFYIEAFRRADKDPLVLLCAAVASLNMVMSRKTSNRHTCTIHAFAFFDQYCRNREEQQEVHYNMARAYHQLGIYHIAVPNYWKVLDLARTPLDRGLQKEAAFNLHHIYKETGNFTLAAQVLRDHCSV